MCVGEPSMKKSTTSVFLMLVALASGAVSQAICGDTAKHEHSFTASSRPLTQPLATLSADGGEEGNSRVPLAPVGRGPRSKGERASGKSVFRGAESRTLHTKGCWVLDSQGKPIAPPA